MTTNDLLLSPVHAYYPANVYHNSFYPKDEIASEDTSGIGLILILLFFIAFGIILLFKKPF